MRRVENNNCTVGRITSGLEIDDGKEVLNIYDFMIYVWFLCVFQVYLYWFYSFRSKCSMRKCMNLKSLLNTFDINSTTIVLATYLIVPPFYCCAKSLTCIKIIYISFSLMSRRIISIQCGKHLGRGGKLCITISACLT